MDAQGHETDYETRDKKDTKCYSHKCKEINFSLQMISLLESLKLYYTGSPTKKGNELLGQKLRNRSKNCSSI
jgi:hypothetical protein